jgi:hypothetical protein
MLIKWGCLEYKFRAINKFVFASDRAICEYKRYVNSFVLFICFQDSVENILIYRVAEKLSGQARQLVCVQLRKHYQTA